MPFAAETSRWGSWLLRGTVVLCAVAMLAGLARSFLLYRSLPSIGVEYTRELQQIVQQRGLTGALDQLRIAARVDFDNVQSLERLLEAARATDDVQATSWALQELVHFRPDDAELRQQLVSELLRQGRVYEAFEHGRVAVRLAPDSATAYNNCGAALLGLERKPEAAAYFRRALELDPTSTTARQALEHPLRGY